MFMCVFFVVCVFFLDTTQRTTKLNTTPRMTPTAVVTGKNGRKLNITLFSFSYFCP